ncbi:MAG: hypothetical protein D6681_13215 [Calditrichaeota bacterium]|nr:MAG: hypothetical protein D6681_13215 [Calditrichota bacterium]
MQTSTRRTLDILYQDEWLVAVDKPSGIHVHPTHLSRGEDSCRRILRDQLGRRVYTVHRLDRATSGVLLVALDVDTARALNRLFEERQVKKQYLAVVRGYTEAQGVIDHPLRKVRFGEPKPARTEYRRLATVELPYAVGKFPTARYSLVEIYPHTGRKNQIRRHFNHIAHPIIGDTAYGDNKHNRFFREHFGIHRLLLMATELSFVHPHTGQPLTIRAPIPAEVAKVLESLGWLEVCRERGYALPAPEEDF